MALVAALPIGGLLSSFIFRLSSALNFPNSHKRSNPEVYVKFLISQAMKGLSEDEIRESRAAAVRELEEAGHEVLNSIFEDFTESDIKNVPLAFLAKSLEMIAKEADTVLFIGDWKNARGCKLEHECCIAYGVPTAYEKFPKA